ncbi:hypothetical protein H8356DRAFT_1722580 [Neocallimastix lanati (nom. inval.)]|uniref:Uncharacterized protein n=1 Tax=Neocallimastix californiae TaxID=1754190 RepID=A0A1Y2AS92_9FUNG|nr:hypothetical protein H8356DRAFT_1722580 [Neocallimastix sp. JGI-2020a]ORY25423.1 hypothetical protein LY90DRAFT_706337 [Neocallimastix californiae]|eukprot:ORY25423.1 hypothetical protein LY90DRAFT_706337 [Neocallimastix californiae]
MSVKREIVNICYNFCSIWMAIVGYCFLLVYVINGDKLMNATRTKKVSDAIDRNKGVYMFGKYLPLYGMILIEWGLGFVFELIYTRLAFKKVMSIFKFKRTNRVILQSAITCCMVGLMCPTITLYGAFIYYPYKDGFNFLTAISNWFKYMCYVFPYGFFVQLFIIQPFLRFAFKIFGTDEADAQKRKVSPIQNKTEADLINFAMEKIEYIKKNLITDITKLKANPNENDLKTYNDEYYNSTYFRSDELKTNVYIAKQYVSCEYSPYGYRIINNITKKTIEYDGEYKKVDDAATKV